MSNIISSSIIEDSTQIDGRRYLRYSFIVEDNLLNTENIIFDRGLVDSGFDENVDLINAESVILGTLALQEETDILGSVLNNNYVLNDTLNPKYSTPKRIAKFLIRFMMRKRNPFLVIALEDLIVHMRDNFTATQLANFLDVTTTTLNRINDRINKILEEPASITSAKTLLNEFSSSTEEI